MKKLIALTLLGLLSAATSAAPVTITFDDPTTETYAYYNFPGGGGYLTVEKSGFVVTALDFVGSSADKGVLGATFDRGGFTDSFPVSIERTDGGAFALHSFAGQYVAQVQYRLADGSIYSVPNPVDIGSGVWLNVTGVAFFPADFAGIPVHIDDIVVSAVPIPAAVWLFASALGLLGVRRRLSRT